MKRISYKNIVPFVLGAGMLSGCATSRSDNLARYVVTGCGNNLVEFVDVGAAPTIRLMTFNNQDTEQAYYRTIQVGDTIGCARPFSDSELVVPVRDANIRLIRRPDILFEMDAKQR